MAGRRAVTEAIPYDDEEDGEAIDMDGLDDEEMQEIARAYAM